MCVQSQLSSLARGAGKCRFNGKEVFVAMKAYCDGSGSADTSPFVVLAGVAAEESVWNAFERDWDRILKDRRPIAPYLHMNEVAYFGGRGPFKNENGWTDEKRTALVHDCLAYFAQLDKTKFRAFICTIDMREYRRVKQEGASLPSVARICNKYVPMNIFAWYLENFTAWSLPELYYEFDQNERFIGPFQTLVAKLQKRTRRGLYTAFDAIKQIAPANMRNALPLQLADVIAWAHHRKLTPHKEGLAWERLHFFTDKVLPFRRKDIDEIDLKVIALNSKFGTYADEYFDSLTFPRVTMIDP